MDSNYETTASRSVDTEDTERSEITVENYNLQNEDKEAIIQCVHDLKDKNKREKALQELSKKREFLQDLAPVIWHSIGTISALLQEIISIYPLLNPALMSTNASSTMLNTPLNRACNVLALLQCVAAHPETRSSFLKANIQLFLYPFLNTVSKSRAYEYLRLTSLGVIGALVKIDDPNVINNLLHTEIIPLSLRIMERGTELSQTVATFIIQKILSDTNGLNYICQTKQRFLTVVTVMDSMVNAQISMLERSSDQANAYDKANIQYIQKSQPSARLLKHIARCYQKLFDNAKAKDYLAEKVPVILHDKGLENYFDENTMSIIVSMRESIRKWINENRMNQNHRMMQRPQTHMPNMMSNSPGLMAMGNNGMMNYTQQPSLYKVNSQRAYMPNNQNSGMFPRPGSSQSHITPLESQNLSRSPNPVQSPPIQHNTQAPKMYPGSNNYMQYNVPQMGAKPMDGSHPHMMRMASNQSPYQMYPTMMHGHHMPDHSQQNMNMYMQPGMHNQGYMMPPQPQQQMPRTNSQNK